MPLKGIVSILNEINELYYEQFIPWKLNQKMPIYKYSIDWRWSIEIMKFNRVWKLLGWITKLLKLIMEKKL
jgi:hypothetical protein